MFRDGSPAIDEQTVESTVSLTVTLAWAAAALVAAYIVVTLLSVLIRRFARHRPLLRDLATRLRHPMRVLLMIVAVWVAFRLSANRDEAWYGFLEHGLLIASIIAGAWLVGAMAFVVEDRTLARLGGVTEDRHARRVRTQVNLLRRITVAVLVICAIAAVLLTFPALRGTGSAILASAGLLSVVAGIAAQSSLANTFAGMQIAFTDAIRVDDVVVLDGEFGRIEEITLTYVVVHAWDDRRLILPSTYFTTTPFENWTRRAADLLGTIEIDVDFNVPLVAMRAELDRILHSVSLWDERVGVLQVTSATEGVVRVRALVSAADAPSLWDLRCAVREGLVEWLQREAPYAMPRRRFEDVVAVPARGTSESGVPDGGAPDAHDAAVEEGPGVSERSVASSGSTASPGSAVSGESAASAPVPGSRVGRRPGMPVVVPGRSAERPSRPSVLARELRRPVRSNVPPAGPGKDATVVLGEVPAPERGGQETVLIPPSVPPGLYSGSEEAEARSRHFDGPGQEAIDERELTAVRRMTGEVATDEPPDISGKGGDEGGTDGGADGGSDGGSDGGN